MKSVLIASVITLAAGTQVFALDCGAAEDAFFMQNERQSFAQDRQAFLADPDRWGRAAKDYLSDAQLIGLSMTGTHRASVETARKFLVNAEIVDCWRPSVSSGGPRTKAIASHFDAQMAPTKRNALETFARSMQ